MTDRSQLRIPPNESALSCPCPYCGHAPAKQRGYLTVGGWECGTAVTWLGKVEQSARCKDAQQGATDGD